MRRINIFLGVIFAFIILHSCVELDTDNSIVGDNIVVSPNAIYKVDTMSLNMSTIVSDSVNTTAPIRLLSGEITDLVGVKTYCESYFQFAPAKPIEFLSSAVYDSAVFRIKVEGYHIGDTTKVAKFGLFRVTEPMEFKKFETPVFYAHHQFASEATPWAEFEVDLSKTINRSIDFQDKINDYNVFEGRIKDDIGRELYDLVGNNSDVLDTDESFSDVYNGFVIKPLDANANLIVGFMSQGDSTGTPEIEVYYHDNSSNDDLSFKYGYRYDAISNSTTSMYAFNHIENDLSNSEFKNLQPGEAILNSSYSNNLTYLNAGTNVQTRFDLYDIDYLFNDKHTAVISAYLIFEPAEGTYNDFFDLPQMLNLDLLNYDNTVAGNIMMLDGTTRATAYLTGNDEFNKYEYRCDITRYIKDIYDLSLEKFTSGLPQELGSIERGFSLRFVDSNITSTVDRLVLGDFKNKQNGISLEITFISN